METSINLVMEQVIYSARGLQKSYAIPIKDALKIATKIVQLSFYSEAHGIKFGSNLNVSPYLAHISDNIREIATSIELHTINGDAFESIAEAIRNAD